ncbi:nucleoside triphosphate pyrophosphohydrolase [Mesobacillus subterraneus]|uniref:Phosphoribosyl-ATP pyrophosphohydrolase n=1 Tax=Mesobacillus subterraneus TaxID=285983 RepID=A0A3R9FF49_9BACI|nr:nucleoside triphosphate pyrophosphohydrolase [Mesobacillus subterraneus]RSD24980.1 phosphoribosyl-ATP pyrophosphohydrolase [Mesobacillus subterraneus]
MENKEYNKLVRDYFPELMKEKGKAVDYEVLDGSEYSKKLMEKFDEEVNKFRNAGTDRLLSEIVDLLEVVYAIAEHRGITEAEVEFMRQLKRNRSGGFKKRIMLKNISGTK